MLATVTSLVYVVVSESPYPYSGAQSEDLVFKRHSFADENEVPRRATSRCLERGLGHAVWSSPLQRLSESPSFLRARNILFRRCDVRRGRVLDGVETARKRVAHQLRSDYNTVQEDGLYSVPDSDFG